MTRFLTLTAIALLGLLFAVPSNAGYYGGYNYGHGYNSYYGGFSYYPTYYAPTIPTYGYSYYQPSYYTPSYYTPTYAAPSYSGTNYKDGNYHYHEGQNWQGRWWPAGQYRWDGYTWIMQGGDLSVPVAPDDWKQTLLKVSAKRDEYAAYLAALKAMGVSPPPEQPAGGGFAAPHGYGVNKNYNLGTYGANGSTLYGYTVQNLQSLYGDASTASLFQQAAQLASNAQALGGEAAKQFQSNVAEEGRGRQRAAEHLARGLAAAEALRAAQGSESHQSSSTTTFGTQPPGDGQQIQQVQPRAQGQQQVNPAFVTLATAKCLQCHGPDKQEAKFDVRGYSGLPSKEKAKVWQRLLTTDAHKRMPKDAEPLTAEEMQLFFTN